MKALVSYSFAFAVLCAADYFTTRYGVASGAGTELNQLVADESGSISGKFLAINGLFCLVFAAMFTTGWHSLDRVVAPRSWAAYFGHLAGSTAYGQTSAALAVLMTRALVPLSNLSAICLDVSLPSILKPIVGTGTVLMWTTIVSGIVIGVLLARPVTNKLVGAAVAQDPIGG